MKKLQRKFEQEIHLNLTPMMDLFVGLIPFLIISSAWVRLGGIDVQAPTQSSSQQAQVDKKKTDEIWIQIELEQSKVTIQGYTKNFESPLPAVKTQVEIEQLEKLQQFFADQEKNGSRMGPALFHASSETKYEQAIKVLEVVRGIKAIPNIVMAAGVVQ